MKNSTKIKIPQKYHSMIKEIYQDEDGYWVVLECGYTNPDMGGKLFHEETTQAVLKAIKIIEKE